jgi:hypothetical protein
VKKTLAAAAALTLILAGCGGDDADTETTTPEASPTATGRWFTGSDAPTKRPPIGGPAQQAYVPAGFKDAFPVTIEYKIDGWTYARTFYGGPPLTAYKDVENAPPGYAQIRIDWEGDLSEVDESGEISLDEGRNAPGTDDAANVRWDLLFNSSSTWDSSQIREIISPDGCGYERSAEPQFHWCPVPRDGRDSIDRTRNDPEKAVDKAVNDFDEIDAILIGVEFDQVFTNQEAECLVRVRPNGSLKVVDVDGEFIMADQGSSCVNVYKGTPENKE